MKIDRACMAAKLPIQIVTVPKEISPECGMAIETRIEHQNTLEHLCSELGVSATLIRR